MFLSGLEAKLGATKGLGVFNDLREPNDSETAVSVSGNTAFQLPPRNMTGNVLLDNGSLKPIEYAGVAAPPTTPAHASNALLVSGRRSTNGHPLMVAGPQIGYYYPGLTMEIDLHGPGINARGATAATIGYVLIGRSEDYAWSLTSAGLDIVDTYVETLCGGSDTKYVYQGHCVDMKLFDAGVLPGTPDRRVAFYQTVHGPVFGYTTVHGRKVAVTRKRASSGRDALDLLLYRDLTRGNVHNVADFFHAAEQSPQTFNSFYVDDRDIAVYTSGLLPIRPANVDPGLPIDGRGNEEWRGNVSSLQHPQGVNPPDGQIVNWNNKTIAGYQAPDDNWTYGAEQRVQLLTNNLGTGDAQTLESLTSAMNKAATQDVRVTLFEPLLAAVLKTGRAPSPREAKMLALLDSVARERRESPRQEPRRQDRRSRRGDHGRGVDEAGRRVGRARSRVADGPVRVDRLAVRHPTGRPVRRLAHLHGQGPPHAARTAGDRQVQRRLLRQRKPRRLPQRVVGCDQSRG